MPLSRRQVVVPAVAVASLIVAFLAGPRVSPWTGESAGSKIGDAAYWKMVTAFSEPGGYFRSDNLLSNETAFQVVIPELQRLTPAGGVYLGVGPEQNFTYIAALKPRIAFVLDIRRENLLLQLMYKAIVEMSPDRAEFLSRLFSRARPPELNAASSPRALFEGFGGSEPDEALYQRNLKAILDRLSDVHGFALLPTDRPGIANIYRAFFVAGTEIRYSFPRQFGGRWFPSYADLMTATDSAGHNHAFLANEENYAVLRGMELNNLIVPLTGDFGGDKALRAVGDYLRERKETVSYFYVSNVEQYLFQTDAWQHFFANVAALPLDRKSTFIRAFFNMGFRYPPPDMNGGLQTSTLLEPILDAVDAFHKGDIQTYRDVIERSR